jgi:hypothetical protein
MERAKAHRAGKAVEIVADIGDRQVAVRRAFRVVLRFS